jgi:hypothetical protein
LRARSSWRRRAWPTASRSLLAAPPPAAAAALHALEGDVLLLLAQRFPELELDALHQRRAQFTAG